jgi:hypothetical protein
MDEYRLYPEKFRNLAGMLPSRTAKTCKPVEWVLVMPPAKPAQGTYTCFPVAYPLASVRARMGLHMVSFATLMNLPIKSTSCDKRYLSRAR